MGVQRERQRVVSRCCCAPGQDKNIKGRGVTHMFGEERERTHDLCLRCLTKGPREDEKLFPRDDHR